MRRHAIPLASLAIAAAAVALSGIGPKERGTWWMEVAPVLIVAPVLVATYRRARLSDLLYVLMALHAVVLCVGGHWTYAEVPAGFWIRDALGLARNHYDRLGHFMQGFVPAIAAREVLVRWSPVKRGGWLVLFVTSICLAFAALYELIEWLAALTTADGATAFLGTQGDPWDTQWDMFLCLVGAVVAQAALSRLHDRSLTPTRSCRAACS